MRRSSKFIVVAGALAALAVPSVASANVAVENGAGFVGKGDVQTALTTPTTPRSSRPSRTARSSSSLAATR